VFFSNAAIREVPELNAFFHPEKAPSFLLGESYVSTILPGDANDPIRREFATIVVSNFARTASSPLKQDIVPALAEAGWIRISEDSPDAAPSAASSSAPEFPTVVRPVSRSDRMKSRKYRIVEKGIFPRERTPSSQAPFALCELLRRRWGKALFHPSHRLWKIGEYGRNPLRFQSRIVDRSKIDVHPGYFF
jgi:hypothetical protein